MKETSIKDLMVFFDSQVVYNNDFKQGIKNIIALININYMLNNQDKVDLLIKMYDKLDDDKKEIFDNIIEYDSSFSDYVKIKFMSYVNRNKTDENSQYENDNKEENDQLITDNILDYVGIPKTPDDKKTVTEDEKKISVNKQIDSDEQIEEDQQIIDNILEHPNIKKENEDLENAGESEDVVEDKKDAFLQNIIDDIKNKEVCEFTLKNGIVLQFFTFNNRQKTKALIDVYNNFDEKTANEFVKSVDEDKDLDFNIKKGFADYIIKLYDYYEKKDKEEEYKKKLDAFLDDIADNEKTKTFLQINNETTRVDLLTDVDARFEAIRKTYEQLDKKQKEEFVEMVNNKNINPEIKQMFNFLIKDKIKVKSSNKLLSYLFKEAPFFRNEYSFVNKIDSALEIISNNDLVEINSEMSVDYFMPLDDEQKVKVIDKIYCFLTPEQQNEFKKKIEANPKLNKLPLVLVPINKGALNDNDVVDIVKPVEEEQQHEEAKNKQLIPVADLPPIVDIDDIDIPKVNNKSSGLKVVSKKALKWPKEHKKLLIGIGLGVFTIGLFKVAVTHMMINSSLWLVGSKLGWSADLLAKLHLNNLALATSVKGGAYSFAHNGSYYLGGKVGADILYTVGKAKLIGALTALMGVSSISVLASSIVDKIKKFRKEKNRDIETDKPVDSQQEIAFLNSEIINLKNQKDEYRQKEQEYIEMIRKLQQKVSDSSQVIEEEVDYGR